MNWKLGICSLCGDECNPLSQVCGVCARLLSQGKIKKEPKKVENTTY